MTPYRIEVCLPDGEGFKPHQSAIRMWLRQHDLWDYYNVGQYEWDDRRGCFVVEYELYDPAAAMLFKLTWGGI